ncbi:hypothetical protein [Streptomyces sp. NPDC088725]|uniref:hypothetical protein n=1 Tax=Streptomyces sp. NPDC088725 TaxID=3365873 RepID=UPI0038237209
MARSEARRFLTRLSEAFGVDGVLTVEKPETGPQGADLTPNSGLRWPPCECGHSLCPDYVTPGCDVCAALAKQREEARSAGHDKAVREYSEELANHKHGPELLEGSK